MVLSVLCVLQTTVQEFLDSVHLSEYMPLFRANGFYLNSDFEHLLELSGDDFKAMGIKKGVCVCACACACVCVCVCVCVLRVVYKIIRTNMCLLLFNF